MRSRVAAAREPGRWCERAAGRCFEPAWISPRPRPRATRCARWHGSSEWTARAPASAAGGAGKGFEYLDEDGRRITEPSVIERIRELAIPPAWEDVWICPYPMGHIQATGTDAAGRKQYRYHDRWRERRDREKFD